MAERKGFEPLCRVSPTIRFRVGAVMTASVPLREELLGTCRKEHYILLESGYFASPNPPKGPKRRSRRCHETGSLYHRSLPTGSSVYSGLRPRYRSGPLRFFELARLLHSLPGYGGHCLRHRLLLFLADSASPGHIATAQKRRGLPYFPIFNSSNGSTHRIGQTPD